MKQANIAAQLYTLREFLKTPEDIEATLRRVKAIGYDAIQVSGMGPIEPEKLKQLVDDIGLTICATHISYDRLTKDLPAVIREHQLWGCKYVGLGAMPADYRGSEEGYVRLAEEFSAIGAELAKHGLQFVYHNHKFEFEKFGDRTGMDVLLQQSVSPDFGFELDMYWVQAGGASPVDWVNKVKGRMQVIHLKDMEIVDDQQVYAEIGRGNLNWPAIIEACRATGVEWYVVEQDQCRRDPFESLTISYNYLQQLV
ncbi:Sugar phosphate isomerase/epimerase [Paenibacillus sp. UNCCL117]|uniref:sugar phosphate isomerase/epimerase family protein n=1 Tax=unclassified Paenibacillus TaxID=185978 RepID=UPI00088F9970|nr:MULTISPECIES: sugar phosphate isomerase/epimerase [unclassified Paenibacillus]SDE61910.1 Sugar phosphate isomerase/epimerase [Paenibacillus sp. cl123]SFW69843.1 Sugar phosphate isomerase/epimerase [Paenibacillus sp. UNCCL117]